MSPRRRLVSLGSFALVAVASYALQRLWDARTEPPLGTVLLQATIPYYWRCAGALLHGLLAAVLVAGGLPEARLAAALRGLHLALPAGVLLAGLAMLLVP